MVGVADGGRSEILASTLQRLGRDGLVVHGRDGLDKLTTTDDSDVWIVRESGVQHLVLDPATCRIPRSTPTDLRGGTPAENARRARALLAGQQGPLRDVVVLNAAAVILAGTLTTADAHEQFRTAIRQAEAAIDNGDAASALAYYVGSCGPCQ